MKETEKLESDDFDIRESSLQMIHGNNGDYYIVIEEKKINGDVEVNSVRISMSGGRATYKIRMAAHELFEALLTPKE